MPKRTCLFCSQTNLTREHIWPDWFNRWFQRANPHGRILLLGEGRGYAKPKKDINLRQKVVCANCNNGWMSQLQSAAKEIIVPLLETPTDRNDPLLWLPPSHQSILTAWITMTVMVSESLVLPNALHFTQGDRERFRQSRIPPRDSVVNLAQYIGGDLAFTGGGPLVSRVLDPLGVRREKVFVGTYRIGQVACQLVHVRRPPYAPTVRGDIRLPVHDPMTTASISVWPMRSNQVWPPQDALDDIAFETFCYRWNPEYKLRPEAMKQPNP